MPRKNVIPIPCPGVCVFAPSGVIVWLSYSKLVTRLSYIGWVVPVSGWVRPMQIVPAIPQKSSCKSSLAHIRCRVSGRFVWRQTLQIGLLGETTLKRKNPHAVHGVHAQLLSAFPASEEKEHHIVAAPPLITPPFQS